MSDKKVADAIEAAHQAIDAAVSEAAATRSASALERIALSLEKTEGHLGRLVDTYCREASNESFPDPALSR